MKKRRKRKRKIIKIIKILCCMLAVVLLGVLAINIFKEKSSPATETEHSSPIREMEEKAEENEEKSKQQETETTEETALKPFNGYLYEPPAETEGISSTVVITPENDTMEEKSFLQFPCEISGYHLIIEKIGSYSGAFVEDGTNEKVSKTAMIKVKNNGEKAIEYAEITLHFQDDELFFKFSALPAGECLITMEQERKEIPDTGIIDCKATVIEKESMEKEDDKISVKDQGDDQLSVQNLTDQKIPEARIFYKYYLEEEEAYLGGVAFTVRLTDLEANEKLFVQPSHFESKSCKIVMTTVYGEGNE